MKIKAQFIKMSFIMLLCIVTFSSAFFPSQAVNASNVTVTLYMYMYDSSISGQGNGGASGPALTGVLVTGKDGNGVPFSQTTNASGYVIITGATGAWTFTASMYGYQGSMWVTYIMSSTMLQRVLISSSQTSSGYAY